MWKLALPLGICLGTVAALEPAAPAYPNHQDVTFFLDAEGRKQPVRSPADWERRRQHVLHGMQAAMGPLPGPERRVLLDVRQLGDTSVGSLVRRKLSFQSEKGNRVPAYLYLPPGVGKKPAMLVLHQTTKAGKDEPAGISGRRAMHIGLDLAQRGYVVLMPDYPSFGEYPCDFDPSKGHVSGTMKAIWDNLRAVDLLESLPEVDANRIGVIGHSLGGHNAMFTAAFEPRLKVIVSSCGFCRFHKDDVPSWTGPRYMPRLKTIYGNDADKLPFDFPEVIAAFAPRPFLACAAKKDSDFDVVGVQETIQMARPIYELFRKPENLAGYYPEGPHEFPEDARKVAYEFLDRHLNRTR